MDMKGVDLQIALPRTADAGALQHQQSAKLLQDQQHLGQMSLKRTEHERQLTAKADATSESRVTDEGGDNPAGRGGGSGKRRSDSEQGGGEEKAPAHPYKGKYIDFKL